MTEHLCPNVCTEQQIFNPGSRSEAPDSEGGNKIDSQPRHIYLYYFQQQPTSKFYWWQPGDFIISVILSDQMFPGYLFFFQRDVRGRGGPVFPSKFGSNVCKSLSSVLCMFKYFKDPEHYRAALWTQPNEMSSNPLVLVMREISKDAADELRFGDYSWNWPEQHVQLNFSCSSELKYFC